MERDLSEELVLVEEVVVVERRVELCSSGEGATVLVVVGEAVRVVVWERSVEEALREEGCVVVGEEEGEEDVGEGALVAAVAEVVVVVVVLREEMVRRTRSLNVMVICVCVFWWSLWFGGLEVDK